MSLRRTLEPAITPVFRFWWKFSRGMTLGVRGVVEDAEGRVLLVRHTYVAGWYFPGGGVESGETALEALAREMAEEGGVAVAAPPTLAGFYANGPTFPNDHIVLYRVGDWRPCLPSSDGEIAERGFFALDALPPDTSPGTRARLRELYEGAPPSPFWTR
jgi:ADP-ribose pyrophosphatase YjhB (NUDIX family)